MWESRVDHAVGLDRLAKRGERIERGDLLARVHGPDVVAAREAAERVVRTFDIGEAPPEAGRLIAEVVQPQASGAIRRVTTSRPTLGWHWV